MGDFKTEVMASNILWSTQEENEVIQILKSNIKDASSIVPENRKLPAILPFPVPKATSRKIVCVANGCNSNNTHNPGMKFYFLPKNQAKLERWLELLGAEEHFNISRGKKGSLRVCAKHFPPSSRRHPNTHALNANAEPLPVIKTSEAVASNNQETSRTLCGIPTVTGAAASNNRDPEIITPISTDSGVAASSNPDPEIIVPIPTNSGAEVSNNQVSEIEAATPKDLVSDAATSKNQDPQIITEAPTDLGLRKNGTARNLHKQVHYYKTTNKKLRSLIDDALNTIDELSRMNKTTDICKKAKTNLENLQRTYAKCLMKKKKDDYMSLENKCTSDVRDDHSDVMSEIASQNSMLFKSTDVNQTTQSVNKQNSELPVSEEDMDGYLKNKSDTKFDETDTFFLEHAKIIKTFSKKRQDITKIKIAQIIMQQKLIHLDEI